MGMENPVDVLLSSNLLKRVRFGGFLGKLVLFGTVAIGAIAALGFHAGLAALGIYAILAVMAMCLIPAVAFAFKHPQLATLEGSEVITMAHLQQASSKGRPEETSTDGPMLGGTQSGFTQHDFKDQAKGVARQ